MRFLKEGLTGEDVTSWQLFLRGNGAINVVDTGCFDEATEAGTRYFQQFLGLSVTGQVDNITLAEAMKLGFPALDLTGAPVDALSPLWPPKPEDVTFMSYQERVRTFGAFPFHAAGTDSNPEAIVIEGDWVKRNITSFPRPSYLSHVVGIGKNINVHSKVKDQLMALLDAWDTAGLTSKIEVWGGDWVPRFVRGSRVNLSNHSWGTAFDLNPQRNALGTTGALKGQKQSVRELVVTAAAYGFAWGGWYEGRKDPMHFEVYKILDQ